MTETSETVRVCIACKGRQSDSCDECARRSCDHCGSVYRPGRGYAGNFYFGTEKHVMRHECDQCGHGSMYSLLGGTVLI